MLVLWDRKCHGVLRRELLFWNSPQLSGQCVSQAPTLPAAGSGWLEGSEIVTDLPAVCLQNGQGILLFQQVTALANRTETHSLISQRPSSPETSSLTKRMQQQKRKDTWGSVVWAAGTLVTQLWSNTFPELGWVCLWAFPKEHWLWKGFQTSTHQGDYLLPDSLGT